MMELSNCCRKRAWRLGVRPNWFPKTRTFAWAPFCRLRIDSLRDVGELIFGFAIWID